MGDTIVAIIASVFGAGGFFTVLLQVRDRKHEKFEKKKAERSAALNRITSQIEHKKYQREIAHEAYQDAVYNALHAGTRNGELTEAKKLLDKRQDEVDCLYAEKQRVLDQAYRELEC